MQESPASPAGLSWDFFGGIVRTVVGAAPPLPFNVSGHAMDQACPAV